ncbi:hypothetical protein AVEN_255229-1 [Araneus ventricosus]|uniref:Uncharacterized protein n=1 Tax=Araneus ventricosus TaxID=182803 RepID=A0A4Y2B9R4_ARAVE|nr:hypothetical protein AVEN_255229-1 [Araneus ventricosus]
MVDNGLSTLQYQRILEHAENLNCKLCPSHHKVKETKQLCCPHSISVTETSAEITLQTLVDHTVPRICHIEFITEKLRLSTNTAFEVMKWGCDGSEQNRNKQKCFEETFSDESLFSICVVPLQIHSGKDDSKSVICKNPVPSSTKYCRLIKFIFAKESTDLITTEVEEIKHRIKELEPTKIFFADLEISVTPTLIFCIVDGKVCNAVSSCPSTQTCYLCGAKPNEVNKLPVIPKKEVSKEFLPFGISLLHSWIRLMKCVLHISYRLKIKTWQARGAEKKKKYLKKEV